VVAYANCPLANKVLTEEEAMGEEIRPDDEVATVLSERQIIGDNINENVMVIHGRWSVLIKPFTDIPILQRLEKNLPKEIFPSAVGTEADLLRSNVYCSWLDDVHRNGRIESANGAADCKQPCRRTVSVADDVNIPICDPIYGDKEAGRSVSKLNIYTCAECPKSLWMCRPATNEEYGALIVIWMVAWPFLCKESRKYPPNMWQYVIYQRMLLREMGWHRDNSDIKTLKRLKRGEDAYRKRTVSGVENSQRDGTCVIVYSLGNCPMEMCFNCMNPRFGPEQLADMYSIEPTFTMECGPGWISILDNIDDIMMMHRMRFVGVKDDKDLSVRVACVIRRGENMQEFYSDTSTLRVPMDDEEMCVCEPSAVYRGYNT
jgi:hypothetical protein